MVQDLRALPAPPAVGRPRRIVAGAPPELYFVVSAVFHYVGPSFAVLLFARVEVLGVAWLRIASAAIIFAVWRRPWRAFGGLDRDGRRLLLAWGAVLAIMNVCFYSAISRLPLGTVAAIEFLPVIALAAIGARSVRNLIALALAIPGVYLRWQSEEHRLVGRGGGRRWSTRSTLAVGWMAMGTALVTCVAYARDLITCAARPSR
jgi:inner membrane transporter RhtA